MKILWIILFSCCVILPFETYALMAANNDLGDQASLRRGAQYYSQYCLSCHGLQYQRYRTVAQDLAIDKHTLRQSIMIDPNVRWTESMQSVLSKQNMQDWLGVAAPDLSLVVKQHSTDWLYTYLHQFYRDEQRPLGVNNLLVPNVMMPNVLEWLQGSQVAVRKEQGQRTLSASSTGTLSKAEYDQLVRDLVNYLAYAAEPKQQEQQQLGIWVIGFLLIFTILSLFLKKEYWRDVH